MHQLFFFFFTKITKEKNKTEKEKEFDNIRKFFWISDTCSAGFRGVLDESLFFYLEFGIQYLKIEETTKCCELLGNLLLLLLLSSSSSSSSLSPFIEVTLRCAAMFFHANLAFNCFERFVYRLANFVFLYMVLCLYIYSSSCCMPYPL